MSTLCAPAALAQYHDEPGGFAHWWLTPNHSVHGGPIDNLFILIFWITMVVFVAVEATLVVFVIKYRHRKDNAKPKAVFTHGNTRLEMAWTLIPAVILLVLALATKRVWDDYRFASWSDDPTRTQVLVVGEQFAWNVVYPGPDGELGTYLAFPKPTDPKFRAKPYADALKAANDEIAQNPLGQRLNPDAAAPDFGRDDDMATVPGRPLIVPVESRIDLHLAAKDVLHDFFLPNFRVKLDAVPGLRGHIFFESMKSGQSTELLDLANVPPDKGIWLDPTYAAGAIVLGGNPGTFRIYDPNDKARGARRRVWLQNQESLAGAATKRLQRNKMTKEQIDADPKLLADEIEALRADLAKLGVTKLSVITRPHEIVCEELCGLGHYKMRGEMLVVSKDEYRNFIDKEGAVTRATTPTAPPPPATAPTAAAPVVPVATDAVAAKP